jgi:hypothetical protein
MKIELESKDIEAIAQRVLELVQPHLASSDNRRTRPVAGHISQADGSDHENNGHSRGDLGQETAGAGGTEKGLAGAASEGRTDIGSLAGLEQDDQDQ